MIGTDEVSEIATEVWASLLERDLVPAEPAALDVTAGAQVSIHGAWVGRVRIEVSTTLAGQLAAQMFELPEDEIDDELVADAIGELVNIIGGNVKALLPTPSRLGLPEPRGGDPAQVVAEATLACGDFSVRVVVESLSGTGPNE